MCWGRAYGVSVYISLVDTAPVRGHPLASRNHRNTQGVVLGSMQYLPISSNRCNFQYDMVVLWKLRVLGYPQKDKHDSLLRYLQLARLFSKEICQTRSCVIDRERVGPQMPAPHVASRIDC
jgi:hypothetical protein